MTPTYEGLDAVVLVRDVPEAGLRAGDLGAVVHVYGPAAAPEALEVEFVTLAGRTQALRTLGLTDVRPTADGRRRLARGAPERGSARGCLTLRWS